jgi:hypothetical protein
MEAIRDIIDLFKKFLTKLCKPRNLFLFAKINRDKLRFNKLDEPRI